MNSQLDITDRELTLQDYLAMGADKLASQRATQQLVDAKALAEEQAEFTAAWNAVAAVIANRWPFLSVDLPVLVKDDGSHNRLPAAMCELWLRLPADLAPISIKLEKFWDEAAKESRWRFDGHAIQVHALSVMPSGVSGGEYYISSHDIDEAFYPKDFDAAVALAAEIGTTRTALRDQAASLNERRRERNLERAAKQAATPTDADRALALVRELVDLVHSHEQEP